ncbi:hypothetical protein [Novosphingobium sediminis]|uniref:hypothetical protein n=1 Tax=Novosphingobium sediminis TaxID=707214 RepID=UPI001478507A|nr:hypothetical protein [Novosphingobium sediminis]
MHHLTFIAALLVAPVCPEPSHDRLIVQPGRDVCGAALDSRGQLRAPGYLPTTCADPRAIYRIDGARNADVCVRVEGARA